MLTLQIYTAKVLDKQEVQANKEKMDVNKNININIDSYPISMAISIVPNIVEIEIVIDISLTPG